MTEPKAARAIARFFDGELMPLARTLKASGAVLLQSGRESGAASYYVRRARREMAPADFEWGGADSPEALRAELERLWSDPGSLALRRLAPPLAELAAALRRAEEQPAEVSGFVYVMY